ncbi:MAG: hypothetical protein M3417_06980 [Actinomycetota bacterium]|nr:hypothetical protein [Actinomycetota bacterium]
MLIAERIALARDGKLAMLICEMPSGWAVLGDAQFLEGYCVLLADPMVPDLTDLDGNARARFLLDMSLIGEALMAVTPAYRINYQILGNQEPWLHAHVLPPVCQRTRRVPSRPRVGLPQEATRRGAVLRPTP